MLSEVRELYIIKGDVDIIEEEGKVVSFEYENEIVGIVINENKGFSDIIFSSDILVVSEKESIIEE